MKFTISYEKVSKLGKLQSMTWLFLTFRANSALTTFNIWLSFTFKCLKLLFMQNTLKCLSQLVFSLEFTGTLHAVQNNRAAAFIKALFWLFFACVLHICIWHFAKMFLAASLRLCCVLLVDLQQCLKKSLSHTTVLSCDNLINYF